MRTYKITVAYDGTRYQGWQRQETTDRTIQGILEQALSDELGYAVEIDGSGRTDGGVHAKGQTASLTVAGIVQDDFFCSAVNARLPEDIRIMEACLVKNGFHARKSAVGKTYEYNVDTGEKPDVFLRKYSAHFPGKLDLDAMRHAATFLKGTHDFAAFTDKKDEKSTKRTIYDIMVTRQNRQVKLEYTGDGFMYHMVRILTGTLLEVGTGERAPENVERVLNEKDRTKAGFLAPAKGLFLSRVYYHMDEFSDRRNR